MHLDFDACYRAVAARDARFDGRFVTGVRTTGIYCRPVCPARTPNPGNVTFFPHPAAAEAAGFRSCRRCRPEAMPGSRLWDSRGDLVARALRLVDQGVVDAEGVAGLAARLHVSERQLRRDFVAQLGAAPLAVARTRRVQLALQLLHDTDLPVTDVAYAAGFRSLRQFHATLRERCGRPPGELRRGRGPGTGPGITLRLALRPPYAATAMLAYLAARAIPGVEEVVGGRYRRTVATAAGPAVVELVPADDHVRLRLAGGDSRALAGVVARSRALLDLDADPAAVAAALSGDPALAPLVAAEPGLRVPGSFDGFELAVRAVLGQQVTLRGGVTLTGRLVTRCGTPLPHPAGALTHLFPTPRQVAEADLSRLGVPGARLGTLRALAAAADAGTLDLSPAACVDDLRTALTALPGVGRWTADYVALRAGDPDALPAGDLVLRRAAAAAAMAGDERALRLRAESWRPWRGYAAMYLWGAAAGPVAVAQAS